MESPATIIYRQSIVQTVKRNAYFPEGEGFVVGISSQILSAGICAKGEIKRSGEAAIIFSRLSRILSKAAMLFHG